jgi:formylglycine-generating enzyme required for sulfatase activity
MLVAILRSSSPLPEGEGIGVRANWQVSLPTEQQWQRAAQGDDGREYPWGDAFDSSRCNTEESGIKRTTPVNQYPNGISPYGVYDMAGNVWEWCLNEYEDPDITSLAASHSHVVRGGSWGSPQDIARVACRGGRGQSIRSAHVGFRVVCVPPSS